MTIKFDIEPVYADSDKYIKTKMKFFGDKIKTNFQGKKVSKENVSYKSLLLTMLDFFYQSKQKVLSLNAFGKMQI